jgi:hypothetical protein
MAAIGAVLSLRVRDDQAARTMGRQTQETAVVEVVDATDGIPDVVL